uniref:Variant surface glycoprotein 1125.1276 n=1 Tax=Trypanosoma brucei TaxID=5691 RepID=M4SY91_9TRYP|nr:variant surface glycoprotein 1318 [Trypanosoma brucei]APD73509.1 variant surface glycoprotein 1125.1276 [Trypanosoma brucei]
MYKTLSSAVVLSIWTGLLLQHSFVGHAANAALKAANLQPYCTFTQEAKRSAARLRTAAQKRLQAMAEYNKLSLAMQLAITRMPKRSAAWRTIAAYAQNQATAEKGKINTLLDKGLQAASVTTYAAGRIDEFVHVFKAAHNNNGNRDTNTCIEGIGGNNKDVSAIAGCDEMVWSQDVPGAATLKTAFAAIKTSPSAGASTDTKTCKMTDAKASAYVTSGATADLLWGLGVYVHDSNGLSNDDKWGKDADQITLLETNKAAINAFDGEVNEATTKSFNKAADLKTTITPSQNAPGIAAAIKDVTGDEELKAGEALENAMKQLFGSDFDQDQPSIIKDLEAIKLKATPDSDETELLSHTAATISGALATTMVKLSNKTVCPAPAPATKQDSSKKEETEETCAAKGLGDACKDGCKEIAEKGEKKCVVDKDYKPKK